MVQHYLDPSLADRLSVWFLIVERRVDGVPGAKHGIAVFVIQELERYFIAPACCCRTLTSCGSSTRHRLRVGSLLNHGRVLD